MKKFIEILSLTMALVMAFAIGSYAAEETDITEPTTQIQEETTTLPHETPSEETTTQPEEETTTQPDVTEPTVPEITLPAAPGFMRQGMFMNDGFELKWGYVPEADGYDVYVKTGDEWVLKLTTDKTSGYIKNLLLSRWYDVGIKSYIIVDGVKYQSESYCTGVCHTGWISFGPVVNAVSVENGIKLTWTRYGVTGYNVYIKDGDEWKVIANREDMDFTEYIYEDAIIGEKYEFRVGAYLVTETGETRTSYGEIAYTHVHHTKSTVTVSKRTSSSINIKWTKVDGATGYRAYIYKDGKWNCYKGIKKTKFTFDGLEASTNYKVRVRAYFQADGKTTWGVYSDTVKVETKSKTVKATKVSNLKKYFTDGDWCVKVTDLKDNVGYKFDYTLAVKGNKVFARYDYKNNKVMRDFEYLIDMKKEKVYIIFDDDKTYAILKDDLAHLATYSVVTTGMILDMSNAKSVKAKTTIYKGKTGVEESYTDRDINAKKTFYFVGDKLKAMNITYSDGSTESLTINKIYDTPSASLFKVPSGYKKIAY